MDEADWTNFHKPILSEELIAEIGTILSINDPASLDHLAKRLQRYSNRYFFAKKRARFTKTPGEARDYLAKINVRVAKLQDELLEIAFIDQVTAGYRAARRGKEKNEAPSFDRLDAELSALRSICTGIQSSPALPAGQKGRPLLRHAVAFFMALFEAVAGARPRHSASQDGDKGDYLTGRGGIALRMVFEVIAPDIKEPTLARLVANLDAEFGEHPMREGDFDLISAMEDAGGFDVVVVQHQ